jgi:hypothetical protein
LRAPWREDKHTGWKTASSAIPAHPEVRSVTERACRFNPGIAHQNREDGRRSSRA